MSRDFLELLEELRRDRRSGASELARTAVQGLGDLAGTVAAPNAAALAEQLAQMARQLAAQRPSMAPLQNLLRRFTDELDPIPGELEAARAFVAARSRALAEQSRNAVFEAAAHAAALIRGRRVLTHSLSSSVREALRLAAGSGLSVTLTESRPLYEGHRLAAALSEWRVPATLITDAQLGLAAAEADLALIGADTLLADGSVVNKAGTLLLALACRARQVPCYVCCERLKRSAAPAAELEAMDPAELGAPGWPGVRVTNRYFDVTPARLVSGWIDERGLSDRFL